jgi:hypothetical protein
MEVETIVCACSENIIAEVQGETVLLQLASGRYFGFNEVGTRIWRLIQSPASIAALIDQLFLEYDVEREQLQADVISLVAELLAAHLAEVKGIEPSKGACAATSNA